MKKTSNDFIEEMERLLKIKTPNNNPSFLKVDSLFNENINLDRKEIIKSHVDKMKRSQPSWNKFEHAMILYEYMCQYKSQDNLNARKNFKECMNDKNPGQIFKKILRIHHFFHYLFNNNCEDAHKNCAMSIQDFYMIDNNQWQFVAQKYGFFNDYINDLFFWQSKGINLETTNEITNEEGKH